MGVGRAVGAKKYKVNEKKRKKNMIESENMAWLMVELLEQWQES